VMEYVEAIIWALVLTLVLRAFVIQAFRIPSESMVPTLLVGDFLFVNKFEYGPKIPFTHVRLPGLRPPRRGDVIVFQWPVNPSKDFIKRCIATGGQTIEVRDKKVIVDGDTLREPYAVHIDPGLHPKGYDVRDYFGPFTVKPGELFMMGDNRDNSNDSRLTPAAAHASSRSSRTDSGFASSVTSAPGASSKASRTARHSRSNARGGSVEGVPPPKNTE